MQSIQDKLDSLVLSNCPNSADGWSSEKLSSLADTALRRFPALRGFSRVVATGSFRHGTAIEANSGIDLLVLRDRPVAPELGPSQVIDELAMALGVSRAQHNKHGILVSDAEIGHCCLIPGVSRADGLGLEIIDFDEERWRHSCPFTHALALQSFDNLGRCAVRFVKTWNNDQVVALPPFHIEAIAIAASITTEAWSEPHIHWKIKTIFDLAKEQISDRRGHPLDAAVILDDIADRQQALRQLEQAKSAADAAWFLMEFEPDLQSAVGAYAALLDPTLGR